MLTLTTTDISLAQTHTDKLSAIDFLAQQLTQRGLVKADYVQGMKNREAQNSTYLGNGIAIPHGTTDTRHLVEKTGVAIAHFPNGIDWGEGNRVYLAIGIAAKSDEHLGILKQLTKVLSADGVEQALKNAKNEQEIIALLEGNTQLSINFDASQIQLDFPASDMVQMTAVAAGLLKNSGCASSELVADFVSQSPTHLGEGVWLACSSKGVSQSGMSFVTTANQCRYEQQDVRTLIGFAACNSAHHSQLKTITEMLGNGEIGKLNTLNVLQLLSMFGDSTPDESQPTDSSNSQTFTIKNAHGLHARPGAMLVACAKKFDAAIAVRNLDTDSQQVNAKSLMKVIALGVKHGHKLEFSADGHDAQAALEAIGQAIQSGLGEG
ncbi:fused PTS fructose transporter subunit IIA/HPr protein [Vibrio intestinalis]|uniref:fused PTS fructose transporter subunit IIA/HPr protein n=1 Tax=Vibrio intestinalis TaxID=2933291 RepID=UPI0021A5FB92|nr:fused PTS fructose transporter subunit IIA/HPr protein [Vibrio intestinalis]